MTKNSRIRYLIALLLVACFSQSIPAQQEARQMIRPVFQTGKTYRFVSSTHVYMAPPGEAGRQITMDQQARYDVDPRPSGRKGVALRGLTEHLQVKIRSAGKEASYDSWKKEDEKTVIGQHFESTVNRYVKMELDENLRILSTKEAGRSGAATPLPDLPRFGPEELVQLVGILPQGYSPDPVRMGDEWVLKGKRPVGDLGELGFEINYRHLGLIEHEGHACVAIEFRGQMTGDVGDAAGKKVDFQGSRIAGRILYDIKEKMTRYSEHNVSMIVHVPSKDGSSRRRKVPMQQKVVLQLMQIVKK